MEAFLEQLAGHIISRYPDSTGKLCVVLPNRRSGLFLKKHLANRAGKSIWAPKIYAIEDFFYEQSGYLAIDQLSLLFELYEVHRSIGGQGTKPFESFVDWGSALLDDFNEIDLYLVNARDLFLYLSEAKAIERWHPDGTPLSNIEKEYIEFYRSLGEYYRKLNDRLQARNLAYNGMAYRSLVNKLPELKSSLTGLKVIFAGFNAFSRSEEVIIQYLLEEEIAEIFWDADTYYVNDKNQEAGKFLNGYFRTWSNRYRDWVGDYLLAEKKEIFITGIPKNISQAKYCGQLIDEIFESGSPDQGDLFAKKSGEEEKIAIVLADENLLVPVLHSLPDQVKDLNITMGYPLVNTPLGHLMQDIFRMQESAAGKKTQNSDQTVFYIKDINRILLHPYFSFLFDKRFGEDLMDEFFKVRASLLSSRKAYHSSSELISRFPQQPGHIKEFFEALFSNWENPADGVAKLKLLIGIIKDLFIRLKQLSDKDFSLEMEFLFQFSMLFNRLSGLLQKYPVLESVKALRKVFQQALQSLRLPFTGEPLKGIQIMGMLETRALDFDTIIMLSVNENILPAGKNYHSFIPFDIKYDFGLPTHREKESIYAYHFYRLLQRAKKVHLMYNTEGNDFRGGEKSRFIHQLLLEVPKDSNIRITESVLQMPDYKLTGVNKISIHKGADLLDILYRKVEDGLSPTSLSTYISCPLRFYLGQIAGIRELEELEETVDAATLGEVVHKALQLLYGSYISKQVNTADIDNMMKSAEEQVNIAFARCYEDGDLRYGKNHLIRRVAQIMTINYLKAEKAMLKENESVKSSIKIIGLEEKAEVILPVSIAGREIKAKLKGRADRVDEFMGKLRIIDYKTGRVYPKEIKFSSWEELTTNPDLSKGLQLLVYQYLFYGKIKPEGSMIESGIFSLRMPSKGLQCVTTPSDNDPAAIHSNMTAVLKSILESLLDPEIPFDQTEDAARCTYCPFTSICNR